MAKPLGGRGKTAPYKTIGVRIPEPIKSQVQQLCQDYRDEVFGEATPKPSTQPISLDEALENARQILKQRKSAKVSMQKLLTSIYKTDVSL